jgi:hypothetical protein
MQIQIQILINKESSIHYHVDGSCKGFCEMNFHSQVALFYQLKGSNFRHVGCEIKSKQGVSFGLFIACVDSDALNSAIGKNPFDFKHYKINFAAVNLDGRQTYRAISLFLIL